MMVPLSKGKEGSRHSDKTHSRHQALVGAVNSVCVPPLLRPASAHHPCRHHHHVSSPSLPDTLHTCRWSVRREADLAAPCGDRDNSEPLPAAGRRLDKGLSGGDSLLVSIDVILSAMKEVRTERMKMEGRIV
ncbi:hypothetical protein E2C01_004329 [Portunus trituberculatus]|uniref:Uncharacterized protein n=1 Tax=Portunus trituberculatus TaxID=210409 RepID=A0A5B7CPL6_PORTR|nr:hypothetical protein [Portunus trituberculatus]